MLVVCRNKCRGLIRHWDLRAATLEARFVPLESKYHVIVNITRVDVSSVRLRFLYFVPVQIQSICISLSHLLVVSSLLVHYQGSSFLFLLS